MKNMLQADETGIPDPETDDRLIARYLKGDTAAFDILYGRYRKMLYAYLNRLTGNSSTADDLFQQTWIRAIGRFPKYEARQKFFPWLAVIAHNLAMDLFRQQRRSGEVLLADGDKDGEAADPAAPASSLPWKGLHDRELDAALEQAQKQLDPLLREVFLLRCRGVSFKEIARIQNCPVNTALGRMNYALKNLRRQLTEWL